MMRDAFRLLALLEEKWPPDGGFRHGIHPSGEPGFAIELSIRRGKIWEYMNLEESDLDRSVEDLVAEIEAIFASRESKPA